MSFKYWIARYRSNLNYLLFLLLLISSLLVLIKIPILNLSIHNFLLPLWSVLLILLNYDYRLIAKQLKPLLFLTILSAWCIITSLFSDYQSTALVQTLKYLNYPLILIALLLAIGKTRNKLVYYKIVILFLNLIGILGIVEYFYPQLKLLDLLKTEIFYPRITSILQNPNSFGVLMAIAAIITVILYKQKHLNTWQLLLQESIFITTTSLSGSRNSWLVLIFGLGLLLYFRLISYKLVGLMAVTFILSIWFLPVSKYRVGFSDLSTISNFSLIKLTDKPLELQLPDPQGTAFSRLLLWQRAIQEVKQRPITGLGMGVFSEHISSQVFGKSGFNTHNLLLDISVDLGLPGLLIVVVGIAKLWQKVVRTNPLVIIPLILLLIAQLVDFFLYDFSFTTIEIFLIAAALVPDIAIQNYKKYEK